MAIIGYTYVVDVVVINLNFIDGKYITLID